MKVHTTKGAGEDATRGLDDVKGKGLLVQHNVGALELTSTRKWHNYAAARSPRGGKNIYCKRLSALEDTKLKADIHIQNAWLSP